MIILTIKNIKEIEKDFHKSIREMCETKRAYYEELFKNYGKDLNLEVVLNKEGNTYKTSASLNLKTKKMLIVEEGKDIIKTLTRLFSGLKKAVKHQYEIERKDYLYKRKR